MIVEFKIPWGWKPTPEEAETMSRITDAPCEIGEDGTIQDCWKTRRGELELILPLIPDGVEVKGIGHIPTLLDITRRLDDITHKLVQNRDRAENEKLGIYQPGLGLIQMNEVKLMGDCCTEELQDLLDDGWRILAACPQPDQRRPDYVLTRFNMSKTT